MQKQSKYENMAYVALWGLLFAAPLLSLYVRTTGDDGMAFNWQEAFMVWRRLAVFLLIFLVHNFFRPGAPAHPPSEALAVCPAHGLYDRTVHFLPMPTAPSDGPWFQS